MIQVFMTHYARVGCESLTDVTVEAARQLVRVTPGFYRLTVLGWTETDALWADLEKKLVPVGVTAVRNDRPHRPDTQPSQRNKVLELARASGDEPFVLLHNDVRPAFGWLDRIGRDLEEGERRWGRSSSIVSPRYIPFHKTYVPVWDAIPDVHMASLKTEAAMAEWCKETGFSFANGSVVCPPWTAFTDDGHQLMMFATRPSFFEAVGECDETFLGANYDDSDWGIRALKAGKRSLVSQSCLMGHAENLSFRYAKEMTPADNQATFVAKWGPEVFESLLSGKLWPKLHREQLG
jgi:hypothetical protein